MVLDQQVAEKKDNQKEKNDERLSAQQKETTFQEMTYTWFYTPTETNRNRCGKLRATGWLDTIVFSGTIGKGKPELTARRGRPQFCG